MDIIEDWKNNNKKPEDMILLTDCKGYFIPYNISIYIYIDIYIYIYILIDN